MNNFVIVFAGGFALYHLVFLILTLVEKHEKE